MLQLLVDSVTAKEKKVNSVNGIDSFFSFGKRFYQMKADGGQEIIITTQKFINSLKSVNGLNATKKSK